MAGDTFDAGTVYAEVRIDRDQAQRDLRETRAMLKDFEKSGPYNARVGVDLGYLRKDVASGKKILKDFAKDTYKAGIGLQLTRLRADIANAKRMLSSIDGQEIVANARLNLVRLLGDIGAAELALRAITRGRDITVSLKTDVNKLRTDIETALRDREVKISVVLDDAALDQIQQRLQTITQPHVIPVETVGTAEILAELEAIHAQLRRVSGTRWNIRVNINTAGLSALLGIRSTLLGLPRRILSQVVIDTTRPVAALRLLSTIIRVTAGAVGALIAVASALAPVLGSIAPLASAAAGALALIPAGVAGIGAAFAAVKIGTSGVGDAFKALQADSEQAATGVASGAKKQVSAQNQIKGALQSLEDAQRSQARTARSSAQAVEDAVRSQTRTARDGARQVADARTALADTIEQANERLRAADDRLTEVVAANAERMASARRNLSDTIAASDEKVGTAEARLVEAHKRLESAQRSVTDAVKDAREANEDLALSLRSGELSVTEAEQSLARARERLANMPTDSTALDVQEQVTAVERAKLSLDEARERYGDLAEEAADAAAKGVEGADNVVAAKEREADAAKDVADAEKELSKTRTETARDVADARAELAKATIQSEKDLAEAVKDRAAVEKQTNKETADARAAVQLAIESEAEANEDASRRVTEARLAEKEANEDAARATARAAEGVREAMAATAESADGATAATKKATAAMAGLSANAADFVRTVFGMKAAWEEVKKSIQDRLFAGLSTEVKELGDLYLPVLKDGLGGVAGAINTGTRSWTDFMEEAHQVDGVKEVLGGAEKATASWMQALNPITSIFLDLSKAGLPIVKEMGDDFYAAMTKVQGFIKEAERTGELGRWMHAAYLEVKSLLELLGNVGKMFWEISKAADEAGLDLIGTLKDLSAETVGWLKSPEGNDFLLTTFRTIKDTIEELKPGVRDVLGLLKDIIKDIAPDMPGIARDFSTLAHELRPTLQDIAGTSFDAFRDTLHIIASLPPGTLDLLAKAFAAMYVLKAISPLFAPFKLMLMVFTVARVLDGMGLLNTVLRVTKTPGWIAAIIRMGAKIKIPGVLTAVKWIWKLATLKGIPAFLGPLGVLLATLAAGKWAVDSQLNEIDLPTHKKKEDWTPQERVAEPWQQGDTLGWFGQGWKEMWNGAGRDFKEFWDQMTGDLGKFWDWFSGGWDRLEAKFGEDWGGVWEGAKTKWNEFTGWWNGITGGWTEAWNAFWSGNADQPGVTWQKIVDWPRVKWNEFTTWWGETSAPWEAEWSAFWGRIGQWISDRWGEFTGWAQEKWNGFTAWWDERSAAFETGWNDFWTRIGKWISDRWNEFTTWVRETYTRWETWWTERSTAFETSWNAFWTRIGNWIRDRWNEFVGWVQEIYTRWRTWIDEQLRAFETNWNETWTRVGTWIRERWDEIYTNVMRVWTDLQNNVWNPMVKFVTEDIPEAFRRAVEGIQTQWNRLMEVVRPPAEWLGATVYNGVIRPVWNWVATHVGLPDIPEWTRPAGFATGGPVRGPGTGTSDSIPARLSDGEFVVKESVASRTMPFLKALNGGQAEAMRAAAAGKKPDPMMTRGFAEGGVARAQQVANSMVGKPYVWGGASASGADCSGLWSIITNAARGAGNPYSRIGTTGTFPWPGFVPGLSSSLAIGNSAAKGHMAGTLAGTNYEARQTGTPILGGGAARGADNGYFDFQGSLPEAGGVFASGGGGLIPAWVTEALEKIKTLSGFGERAPGSSQFSEAYSNAGATIVKSAATTLLDKVNPFNVIGGAISSLVGGGSARDQIVGAESGGSYTAQNPTSSASGRYQMIDSTWLAYRGSSTAAHAYQASPSEQDAAADRYVAARYGSWENALTFRNANGWYDQGGMLQPGATMAMNGTGSPEAVLTSDQWSMVGDFIDANATADRLGGDGNGDLGTLDLSDATIERLAAAMARMAPTVNVSGSHVQDPREQAEEIVFALRKARRGGR